MPKSEKPAPETPPKGKDTYDPVGMAGKRAGDDKSRDKPDAPPTHRRERPTGQA